MKYYNRSYKVESNDFWLMHNFLLKENKSRKDDFIWHIARLVDWKYSHLNPRRQIDSNYQDHTRLWFNSNNELLGFVVSEDIDGCFQVFTEEKSQFLYSEMVNWYINSLSSRYKEFTIFLNESQRDELGIVRSLGFQKTDDFESTYVIDTKQYQSFNINNKEVELISMKESMDYMAQMNLRNNAWPKKLEIKEEIKLREEIRKSPIYRADFDFVLVNKDGRFISGCEAFIDIYTNTSELERVCTHSDYWNQGYSRLTLKSTLKRLYQEGVKSAYITSWNAKTKHLYGTLGHHKVINRSSYILE